MSAHEQPHMGKGNRGQAPNELVMDGLASNSNLKHHMSRFPPGPSQNEHLESARLGLRACTPVRPQIS